MKSTICTYCEDEPALCFECFSSHYRMVHSYDPQKGLWQVNGVWRKLNPGEKPPKKRPPTVIVGFGQPIPEVRIVTLTLTQTMELPKGKKLSKKERDTLARAIRERFSK